jgi:hypothetical protein
VELGEAQAASKGDDGAPASRWRRYLAWNERFGARQDRITWRYVVPVVCVVGIGLSITQGIPAYRARFSSAGISGSFTVTDASCVLTRCSAEGFFISDDSSVLKDNIAWGGSASSLKVDDEVPAVYVGNDLAVYPRQSGGGHWVFYSWVLIVFAAPLIVWLVDVVRWLRRRDREPAKSD